MIDKRRVVCVALTLCLPAIALVSRAAETATPDWQKNCALDRDYRGKLIFSAVETTTADGKRAVAWSARDRAAYLAIFRDLGLDGAPDLAKRRDLILEKAAKAPGGGSITLLPDLDKEVRSFWADLEDAAKKEGVVCRPDKK